jgi:hypothetical protein
MGAKAAAPAKRESKKKVRMVLISRTELDYEL